MPPYHEFIQRLRKFPDLLHKLTPTEPLSWGSSEEFRGLSLEALAGAHPIIDPDQLELVRGAILYALDELQPAHHIFQEDATALGSYWHGVMHRREGDFDNARYWFRRAGRLAVFTAMHDAAGSASPTMARQQSWDAYLLTGLCEQARFGAHELVPECRHLIRIEWDTLLAHSWAHALGIDP